MRVYINTSNMSVKIKKNGEFSDSGEYKNQISSHNLCNLYSSDPLKLLKLVECLSQSESSNSVELQTKLNKYVCNSININ